MIHQALLSVLADSETPTGPYKGINPALNAAGVFVAFLILLFLVSRLNRDK